MNAPNPAPLPQSAPARGFSLIELLGAIATLAILIVALLPPLLAWKNRAMREQEETRLQAIEEAVKHAVRTTQRIPGPANFATAIAPLLRCREDEVLRGPHSRRLVVFDDTFRVGTNGGARPPYVQGSLGSIPPVNPRLMVLSSLNAPLPAGLSNGFLDGATFSNLWESTPGTVPVGWAWTGSDDDLRIRRIQLADLFIHLVLNNPGSSTGHYSFNASFTNPVPGALLDTQVMAGTRIGLHATDRTLQAIEILDEPMSRSFVYGAWRSPSSGASPGWYLETHIRGCDLQAAHDAFIHATPNPRNTTTPSDVINGLVNLMQGYLDYVDSGWSVPSRQALDNAAAACKALMNDLAQ